MAVDRLIGRCAAFDKVSGATFLGQVLRKGQSRHNTFCHSQMGILTSRTLLGEIGPVVGQ